MLVNHTNISNAIKAIEGIKIKTRLHEPQDPTWKDRCTNPPRSNPQANGMKRTASGNTTIGVNNPIIDADHIRENGLGLAVNVREDGGEEVLDVNA